MDEILREPHSDLRFISLVVLAIGKEAYGEALTIFLNGIRKLVVSNTGVTNEVFDEEVFHPLSVMVRHKLGTDWVSKSDGTFEIKCSFCGKSEEQVEKIIAGAGVFICEGCVGICNEVLTNVKDTSESEAVPE